MRYYLNQETYSQNVIFGNRSVNATYQLLGSTKVYLGGDPILLSNCGCSLQYARMYWNYVADSRDKMINLAMMDNEGINLFSHENLVTISFSLSIKLN